MREVLRKMEEYMENECISSDDQIRRDQTICPHSVFTGLLKRFCPGVRSGEVTDGA